MNINEPVELTANLSDLELEQIEDQGGEIWFVVDDDEMLAGDTSPPTATWKSGKPGEYRAKVELRLLPAGSRTGSATPESTSSGGWKL